MALALHQLCHHPFFSLSAQLAGLMSLSLSAVVNLIPLELHHGASGAITASPASPLYPSTVSRYLLQEQEQKEPGEQEEHEQEQQK